MDESCKTCIYFHKYKRYVGDRFEESSCCTYFIQDNVRRGITPSYDVWVQDASDEGLCECYQRCNRTQKSFFPECVKIPEMYSHEEIMNERVKDNYNYQRLSSMITKPDNEQRKR